jgi:D-glycero-D-manno-heptose 1,7-bisphosphate phosphatase
MSRKAVFLDKDGTLVENVPYNVDPAQIRLAEGAVEGLQRLHEAGYHLVVVSNQSGVAQGQFPIEALQGVRERLEKLMAEVGVPLAGFYFCPHLPDAPLAEYAQECFCRKPRPGMLFQAAREHNLNLAGSWMVGDILDDIEAGRRAGCGTVLIDNGGETEWQLSSLRQPNQRVKNLAEAAQVILAADQKAVASAKAAAIAAQSTAAREGLARPKRPARPDPQLPATGD